MKLTHKICGAALLATIGVGVAAPNLTNAAAKSNSYESDGHVKFTDDTNETNITSPTSNSTSTDLTIPTKTRTETMTTTNGTKTTTFTMTDTTPVTNPGDFGIYYVTPLEFGEHGILENGDGADRTYAAQFFTDANTTKEETTPNFVTFKDTRDTADHSYNLQAKLTTPFQTLSGTMLKGAKITYTDPWISTYNFDGAEQDHSLDPKGIEPTVALTSGKALNEAGASEIFINNEKAGADGIHNGFGKFTLSFGKLETYKPKENETSKAVQLSIPKTGNAFNGDFRAKITWTLTEGVAPTP